MNKFGIITHVILDLIESKMIKLGGSQWQCTMCMQVMKKTNLVLHIESKHLGGTGGFSCGVCGKYCSTRKALSIHKSRYQHHDSPDYWFSSFVSSSIHLYIKLPSVIQLGCMDKDNEDADALIRSKMLKTDGVWHCAVCAYQAPVNNLYKHVETTHVSVSFKCNICFKPCKSRDSLFAHRYRNHRVLNKPSSDIVLWNIFLEIIYSL